ncbi:sugar phosphate isomerase/epimerase family protein [Actinomadura viridis]|uniref:sugar phosphate isomerase/epimerase family protein n=1 Tax=Actinomadura viridis TaxID=58110 RepID=UPI0036B933E6
MPTQIPLSCGDHSFRLLEHEHALALIKMLGIDRLDLAVMSDVSHVRPEAVIADVPGWADLLRARLDTAGLELSDVFVIPGPDFATRAPNHPDPSEQAASRAMFSAMLDLAGRLGAPGMTMLPGIVWEDREADLARAATELQWRAEAARERGLRFSVEPHLESIADTPARALALLEQAPDLELTLDYSHFVAQGIAPGEVHPLISRTRHLHARGSRPAKGQCGLRENTIDYRDLVGRLQRSGYDGHIAIEYVWTLWAEMNRCDNLSETVLLRDALRAWLAGEDWSYPANAA